ncbi:hypothetical protein [Pseudovibrio sp. SPO723]|uniref:hypothetical protein n=1 Tax=Nesiotobacter zosterae TaxID=392721 RepID=UPI0029C23BBA|nr:hypothetical protein [Pseudovibrio sp. SPO723]MDX5594159.1 hypothetical protein [Pseudovibrio sp. SPO723]
MLYQGNRAVLTGSGPYVKKSLSIGRGAFAARIGFLRLVASLWVVFSSLFLVSADAFAQGETATITASAEEGFGRIVITFPDRTLLPDYDALVTAGVLRIAFPNGINAAVDEIPAELSDYISVARRDPDGAALRFALKQPVNVNSMEAGEKLFIDLLPRSWQGLPPPLPEDVVADLAKRAEKALRRLRELERDREEQIVEEAQVDLRVGEHPTFTRLVFDWSVPFDSAFVRRADRVEVQFDREATLDLARMLINPPLGLYGARSEIRDAGLFVELAIDPASDVRAFREGSSYVVDVTPTELQERAEKNSLLRDVDEVYADPILQQSEGEDRVVALGVRPEERPSLMPVSPQPQPVPETTPTPTPAVAPAAGPMNLTPSVFRPQTNPAPAPTPVPAQQTAMSEALGQVDDPIAAVLAQADEVAMAAKAFGLSEEPLVSLSAPVPEGSGPTPQRPFIDDEPLEEKPNHPSAKPARDLEPVGELNPRPAGELTPKGKPSPVAEESPSEDAVPEQVDPAPAEPETAPQKEQVSQETTPDPGTEPSSIAVEEPQPAEPEAVEQTSEAAEEAVSPPTAQDVDQRSDSAEEVAPPAQGTAQETSAVNLPTAPASEAQPTEAETETAKAPASPLPRIIPINQDTPAPKRDEAPAVPNAEEVPAYAQEAAPPLVAVEVRRVGNSAQVHLPFGFEVPAAMFRRGRFHWLIFDSNVPIDDRALRVALDPYIHGLSNEDHGDYQVIRMRLKRSTLASFSAEKDRWVLSVGPSVTEPSAPLQVERNVQGDGEAVLRVAVGQGAALHEIRDPDVGDVIYAVTVKGPARGLIKPHRYTQLQFLQSLQGVAVTLYADGVNVEVSGEDVLITRDDGLAVSSEDLWRALDRDTPIKDPTQPGLIEFSNFTKPDVNRYRGQLRDFEAAVALADPEAVKGPRLDMARFYLAYGFAEEALGLLELSKDQDPTVATDATFNVMMGAAQMMAHRPRAAKEYLESPELTRSPDAAVWKTLADVSLEDWPSSLLNLETAGDVIDSYPESIQIDFNLAAAQAHVELEDFGSAAAYLAQIEPSATNREQSALYDLLRGRIADASGRTQEAIEAFEYVMENFEGPEAAEAQYRNIALKYRDGYLGEQEAIDELANLSTIWRGDETELRTLDLLAVLQAKEGAYRDAFAAMHQAILSDPDSEITRNLQMQMGDVFTDLFLREGADKLDAIEALAIFYDFRELLPVGREGDQMVRYMADRMIDLDLLDQAARVLRHQIDHRLKGAAKAQIAADLSVVYLLDRQPEQALRVLSQTRQAQLPATLQRQRNLVEARALTESGRPDLALELVRNMSGVDVDRLRADTLWAAESWQKAAEQIEKMHAGRWADAFPLDEQEQTDILRAAIGYSLSSDSLGLDRLRQKYSEKMSSSPNAAAFEVVTRPVDERGVEFLDVSRSIAATDSLDAFLDEYRRQYLTAGALSPSLSENAGSSL